VIYKANPLISKWGLTWREMDDGYVEIGCLIFMKEVILLGYGNFMNVIGIVSKVDVMIYMLPLGEGKEISNQIILQFAFFGQSVMTRFVVKKQRQMV
jgi:hypothetical protein